MVVQQITTIEAFEAFVALPENTDKLFELIQGEIIEVPSNPYSSQIAALIIAALVTFLKGKDLGHVTGEAGGYQVSGERYAPDVAFIFKSRQARLPNEGYNPLAPDFAVEVVSPSDRTHKLTAKVANYLAAGTMVWVVYPHNREVEIYVPGQPVKTVAEDGILDGSPVFTGFTLPVKDIFPD